MKQLFLIPLFFLFILTGCDKEDPGGPLTGRVINIAPHAFAGGNYYVVLPADSTTLEGYVTDQPFDDIVNHGWRKISGPAACVIESPGMLETTVRNLVKGRYEFELMVIDKGGLTGMDTVTVDVQDAVMPDSKEMVFNNLKWIFPWYSAIEVENMYRYLPPKKVFIQRDSDTTWIEVNPLSDNGNPGGYEYFISTRAKGAGFYDHGSLYIFYYGTLTDDTPQVKIQF
jgi:hypothetical protein